MQRQGARDDRPVRGREEGGQLLEHHATQGAQLGTHLVGGGIGVGVGVRVGARVRVRIRVRVWVRVRVRVRVRALG